ncbi:MAG: hypothetical protein L0H26_07855, partial [Microlunatus sp.]|nr:hypothetical protein [Microlunatus sp.]
MQNAQNPHEAMAAMQSQALDAIRTGQAATLEAVKNWNEAVAKMTPATPATPELPTELKDAMGDPSMIVDSVYDFAARLLELNK